MSIDDADKRPDSDSWETVPLRSIVTKLVDGSHNPPPKQGSGKPMLSARNIENNQIVFNDFRYVSEADFEKENARTRVAAGDVLLTIVGTIGRSAIVPDGAGSFTLQRSVAALTPTGVLPKFLMYQLQAPQAQRYFENNARGTAQKGVYLKTLGQTPIKVAPIDQQRRIVAEIEKQFSRLDEAIANLNRVKTNLKRYKAAALQETLISSIDSPLDWRPLSDVVGTLDQGWSPKCDNDAAADNEWGVIKTTAVQPMAFSDGENKRLPTSLLPRHLLELVPGDILVTRAGPRARVGIACLIRTTRRRLMLCDKVYRLRAQTSVASSRYLEIVLNTPAVIESLNKIKTGISDSGVNLTQERFKSIMVPIPSMERQERVVADIDRQLTITSHADSTLEAALQRAAGLRGRILQRFFRGI